MTPQEQPPDYQAARRELDARDASMECPSCGEETWRDLGAPGNLVFLPVSTLEGAAVEIGAYRSGVSAFLFTCANCGFLRLHSLNELFGPPERS